VSATVRIGDAVGRRVRVVIEGVVKHYPLDGTYQIEDAAVAVYPNVNAMVELVEPTLPTTPGSVVWAREEIGDKALWGLLADRRWHYAGHDETITADPADLSDVTVLYDAGATT